MFMGMGFSMVRAQTQPSGVGTGDSTLFNLSLEDLLNVAVTVSSKQEESLLHAPGNITAYSYTQLEQLGYYTIADLANITPGYSAFRGIGEQTLETRGIKSDGFDNNKHLVLIDGIPFSHTRANRANTEEDLPLFFARQVEFLRGPGSALYGISAFSGVINIRPDEPVDNGFTIRTKFSLGSYDFKRRLMTTAAYRSRAGVSQVSFGYFGKDATREFLGDGTAPDANSLYYDDVTSIFGYASHKLTEGKLKGLGFGLIYSKKTGGLGDFWMEQQNQTFEFNQLTWEQFVPYIRYERQLRPRLSVNSYLKFNMSNEQGYTGGFRNTFTAGAGSVASHYNVRVYDYEWLGEARYKLKTGTNLIGGLNVVSRYSTGAPETYGLSVSQNPGPTFIQDSTFYRRSSTYVTYSMYGQAQHHFDVLAGLTLTGGLRLDVGRAYEPLNHSVTNRYHQLSPRIAVVQRLTEHLTVKALYGSALRAPMIKEVGLNEEVRARYIQRGIPDSLSELTAERIQSLEFHAVYAGSSWSLAATVFHNWLTETLGRKRIGGSNANVNIPGTIKARGFELEGSLLPVKFLRVQANVSYALAEKPSGVATGNVPIIKAAGIITGQMVKPFRGTASVILRGISEYRKGERNGIAFDGTLPGHFLTDLNLTAELTRTLGVELLVRNLFDHSYRTPTFYEAGLLNIPGPGISVLGTLSFKFQ
jgi:outer membrane receptor protein involved in Fe transport